MRYIAGTAIALVLIASYGITGSMDLADEIREEQRYCEFVREGIHPAYKPEIDCKAVLVKQERDE